MAAVNYDSDPKDSDVRNLFDTTLQYRCPLGQKFSLADTSATDSRSQETGKNNVVESFNITCHWNQTWMPLINGTSLPNCVGKIIFHIHTHIYIFIKHLVLLTDYTQTLIHLIELAIGCVSPPLPPPDRNLVRIFEEGSIVDFGDKVTYVCLDGYHFHRSYKQTKYQVVCMKDGNFTKLDALEFCIHPKGKRTKYINLCKPFSRC